MPHPALDPIPDQNFIANFKLNNLSLISNLTSPLCHINHPSPDIISLKILNVSSLYEFLLKRFLRSALYGAMVLVIIILHALYQRSFQLVLIGFPFQLLRILVNN